MTIISQAQLHDTEVIKAFYSQCGYGGDLSTLEEDLIIIAGLEEKNDGT